MCLNLEMPRLLQGGFEAVSLAIHHLQGVTARGGVTGFGFWVGKEMVSVRVGG